MTYTVRIRGGGGGLIAADYRCPDHGLFDDLVERATSAEPRPCPTCGAASERAVSAPLVKGPPPGTLVKGKYEGPRKPMDLDTRPLADGTSMREFKKQRAAKWFAHDMDQAKRKGLT